MNNHIEQFEHLRDKARQLCAERGVAVRPYGHVWWLIGNGINRVVGELAGLNASDLTALPIRAR